IRVRKPCRNPARRNPRRGSEPAMSATTHDIFLSYSRRDEAAAVHFRNAMEEGGYRVWRDRKCILTGDLWRGAVTKGIESSQCLVCLMSANSMASEVVRKEAAHARRKDIPVYLVFLEEVELEGEWAFEHG